MPATVITRPGIAWPKPADVIAVAPPDSTLPPMVAPAVSPGAVGPPPEPPQAIVEIKRMTGMTRDRLVITAQLSNLDTGRSHRNKSATINDLHFWIDCAGRLEIAAV